MIPYILYSALILTASFLFYKLLLQKETFFNLNRFVLLCCMVLAFVLPVLRIPQNLSLLKTSDSANIALPKLATNPNNTQQSLKKNIQSANAESQQLKPSVNFKQVSRWIIFLYWFGTAVFGFTFLLQAAVLLYKAYSQQVIRDGKFRIVEITGEKAPCSFGNNIFINPAKYDWQTYNQILLHEKIHIEQKHTLDLLFAEIVLIFQWFNPFAWLWRKELENNLEFFTDDKLLQHQSVEKESYQLSLLKVAAPHFPLSLTTNYNQSLLKKRLLMMNAKKSNVHTIWKYFFLLPLMVLFVCLFNEPVAKSQVDYKQKSPETKSNNKNHSIKTEGNWSATIKGDKIDFQFKSNDDKNSSNGNSFPINEFTGLPREKEGAFTLTREAGTMEFRGKFEGGNGMGKYKFMPDKNYSDSMIKEGIDVKDDEDAMVFFLVNIKRTYVQMLKQNGYTSLEKDNLIPLAALDVNEAYIKSIRQAGFTGIDLDNLVPLRALNVDKAYIDEIRKAGYKNLTPDKIITFKAQGIDGKYIADFRKSIERDKAANGKEDQKATASPQNKDEVSVNRDKEEGQNENDNTEEDIIAFKAMNIDGAYINSFKEVGYNHLSNSDLISMKALGVTPEYIKGFNNSGYTNIKADELISLKAQNVTPSLIKQYKELGFNNLNIDDIISAKATGTSPAFVISMRQKGHNMKSLDKYVALKAVLGD